MEEKQVSTQTKRSYPACCNISQGDGIVIMELEMPGVSKNNLDIKIDGDVLMIHGTKEIPQNKNGKYILREIRDGDYHHEFTIDNTIDRNKIDALLEKGVLTLTLHIKESEKPRKIQVVTN